MCMYLASTFCLKPFLRLSTTYLNCLRVFSFISSYHRLKKKNVKSFFLIKKVEVQKFIRNKSKTFVAMCGDCEIPTPK